MSTLNDIRIATRSLVRQRHLSVAVIASMALGLGANSSVFAILDTLLFRAPAGVQDSRSVARVFVEYGDSDNPDRFSSFSYPGYEELGSGQQWFTTLAAYWNTEIAAPDPAASHPLRATLVSDTYFALLGVTPHHGEVFRPNDLGQARSRVAVISFDLWRSQFGSDPAIIGHTIETGAGPFFVIGVAGRGFNGMDGERTQVWLPLLSAGPLLFARDGLRNRHDQWLSVLARLPDRVSRSSAARAALPSASPGTTPSGAYTPTIVLGRLEYGRAPGMSEHVTAAAWMYTVALTLLLMCAGNVTCLLLVRTLGRRNEIAVRTALGGTRSTIAQLLATESHVLTLAGGLAGIALALVFGPVLSRTILPATWAYQPSHGRLLIYCAIAILIIAVLTGGLIARLGTRGDLASPLRGVLLNSDVRQSRLQDALVTCQLALAMALAIGAALSVHSIRNVLGARLGFDYDRAIVATLNYRGIPIGLPEVDRFYAEAAASVARIPGVTSTAFSVGSPLGWGFGVDIAIPGNDAYIGSPFELQVSPGYFETIGTRILRGRAFTSLDRSGTEAVAVVNEAMAHRLWPDGDPLGKCFLVNRRPACARVVGVAENTKQDRVTEEPLLQFYSPIEQQEGGATALLIRTSERPEAIVPSVLGTLTALPLRHPQVTAVPMRALVAEQVQPIQASATICTLLGAIATMLAATGFYGLLAYVVSQRGREIGLRMALGATRRDVARLVLGKAIKVAVIGMGIGLAASAILARAIRSLLFGMSPLDPASFAVAPLVLIMVSIVAAYLPMTRALDIDPADALRGETQGP